MCPEWGMLTAKHATLWGMTKWIDAWAVCKKRSIITSLVTLVRMGFQTFIPAYTIFSEQKWKSCSVPKPPKSWKSWNSRFLTSDCAKNEGPLGNSVQRLLGAVSVFPHMCWPRVTIPRHRFGKIKDVLHDFHDFQNQARKSWKSCNENRENRKTDKRVPEGWYWCNTLPIFIVHGCRGL